MDLQAFTPSAELADKIGEQVQQTLTLLGEDPTREGLARTPHRVGNTLQFLTKGYQEDPEAILRSAIFEEDYKQMVVVKDIEF